MDWWMDIWSDQLSYSVIRHALHQTSSITSSVLLLWALRGSSFVMFHTPTELRHSVCTWVCVCAHECVMGVFVSAVSSLSWRANGNINELLLCQHMCPCSSHVYFYPLETEGLRGEQYWSECLINLVWGDVNQLLRCRAILLLLHNEQHYRPPNI